MQKYTASKLLENLFTPPRKPGLRVVFCDDEIFRRAALEAFLKLEMGIPKSYSGKTAIADCVNEAAAGSLFSPAAPAVVELEAKLTAKQWEVDLKAILRLPKPPESPIFIFAPTSLRNTIKEDKFPGECGICWSPEALEARRCVAVLARRYPKLSKASGDTLESCANTALDYYSGDLLSVDLHFERMERTGVDFEGAFIGQTGATAFHVVDALAQADAVLIELKMQQCQTSGEDAAPILKAVAAFLRQLAQLHAGRERTPNLDMVLDNLNVRVPAQRKRLQMALSRIAPERIAQFFLFAPELEMSLRSHSMPHELLASELFGLLGIFQKK
jgi:DNA polymerase III delta subunit